MEGERRSDEMGEEENYDHDFFVDLSEVSFRFRRLIHIYNSTSEMNDFLTYVSRSGIKVHILDGGV